MWALTATPSLGLAEGVSIEENCILKCVASCRGCSLSVLCPLQVNAAAQEIHSLVDAECNLIFGAVVDDNMVDEVSADKTEVGGGGAQWASGLKDPCCSLP